MASNKWKTRAKGLERANHLLVTKIDELHARKNWLRNRVDDLKATSEFLEGKTKHQEGRIRELQAENTQWRKAVNRQNADIQSRQNRINELDSALAAEVVKAIELHQAHATKVQKIKALEAKEAEQHELLARHARELESRAEKIKYQDTLVTGQAEKIDLLYEEIGEMGKTIASQTDSLLQAQNRNARLEQVILGLKKSIQVRDEQLKDIMPIDGESASKQIRKLQDELGDKDEELKNVVDREHRIHNDAAAGMITKVKELEVSKRSMQEKVLEVDKELADTKERLSSFKDQSVGLHKEIHDKDKRIKFLEEQVSAQGMMLASRGVWWSSGTEVIRTTTPEEHRKLRDQAKKNLPKDGPSVIGREK